MDQLLDRMWVVLVQACSEHIVAECTTCRRPLKPSDVGIDIQRRWRFCPSCHTDVVVNIVAHALSCREFQRMNDAV